MGARKKESHSNRWFATIRHLCADTQTLAVNTQHLMISTINHPGHVRTKTETKISYFEVNQALTRNQSSDIRPKN